MLQKTYTIEAPRSVTLKAHAEANMNVEYAWVGLTTMLSLSGLPVLEAGSPSQKKRPSSENTKKKAKQKKARADRLNSVSRANAPDPTQQPAPTPP